jgi:hypothetical protein
MTTLISSLCQYKKLPYTHITSCCIPTMMFLCAFSSTQIILYSILKTYIGLHIFGAVTACLRAKYFGEILSSKNWVNAAQGKNVFNLQIVICWVVVPCSILAGCQCFRGTYCFCYYGWWWKQYVPLKCWHTANTLHGTTPGISPSVSTSLLNT